MILSKEDFFTRLHEHVGNSNTDENIQFIEDMTDTYNSLEQQINGDNWEQKYHELDESWKAKYKARFFNTNGGNPNFPQQKQEDDDDGVNENIQFGDLFSPKK